MIIGFDASRAFSLNRTGTENYSYQLLKALSQIDTINRYLVYLRPGCKLPQKNWPANFQFRVINYPRLWTQLGLALRTFTDELDVLFVPAHTLPIIRNPYLKTVVTVHDLGSEYLPKMHQFKQRLYLGLMQRMQLKTAAKIIAVSQATKKDLVEKIGIEAKKIKVIYEGYNTELFKMVNSDILVNTLRQYGLESMQYFLFVGTIQPRKNLERLTLAFNYLINQTASADKLVIVGSKGWLSDEIYRLPERLGIKERVRFLGYVPDRDMPALYSGAIALAYPSLFEGFGLPILEAQACGCPVLTSNVSSMPEVAGQSAVLVDPYNIDDIVRGMGKIVSKGQRGKIIKQGAENIKRFSWEKCASQTLKVFGDL